MRLATVRTSEGTRAARRDGDDLVLLDHPGLRELLDDRDWREAAERGDGPRVRFAEADLAPVVPNPSKIVCLGMNYKSHIEEMGREAPSHPTLFAKYASSLIGPRDPIMISSAARARYDWEAELAVIIGIKGKNISAERAGCHAPPSAAGPPGEGRLPGRRATSDTGPR